MGIFHIPVKAQLASAITASTAYSGIAQKEYTGMLFFNTIDS